MRGTSLPRPEVIATTLEGDFMVFAANDVLNSSATPLYHARFPGAVGAYNSILHRRPRAQSPFILDLVAYTPPSGGNPGQVDLGQDGKPEIYVAGSSGLRRLMVR